ncbi:hypothetical protein [Amycolatopsis thailandensis]|uniref:hypothetical protein n=1 Tax=Amycolatopsis thailandensis TaxID=589330 RepID=UPI003626DF25
MTCTIESYTPGPDWENHPVTTLLHELDKTRTLADGDTFVGRAKPTNLLVTRLVAVADDNRLVGFLSGRVNAGTGDHDGLSGQIGLVEYIGVLRHHGCTMRSEPSPGDLLIRRFAEMAGEAGAEHLVLNVGASPDELDNTRYFFARNGFTCTPAATSPNRLGKRVKQTPS